jgi:hypothetical protein
MNTQLTKSNKPSTTWTTLPISARKDLSAELAVHLPRLYGDEVRCSRVYGDCYRCNWWTRTKGIVAGATIRQSRFMRVRVVAGKLEVVDLTITR